MHGRGARRPRRAPPRAPLPFRAAPRRATGRRGRPIAARPEAAVLLACARARLGNNEVERLAELVAQRLDWDWLLRMAYPHRVVPLVYRHFAALSPAVVPEAVRDALRPRYEAHARDNLRP